MNTGPSKTCSKVKRSKRFIRKKDASGPGEDSKSSEKNTQRRETAFEKKERQVQLVSQRNVRENLRRDIKGGGREHTPVLI